MTEALRGQIRRRVPAIDWLRRYDRRQLRPDLLARVRGGSTGRTPGPSAIAGPWWNSDRTPFRLPSSRTRSSAPRVNWWPDLSRPSR